MSSAVRTTVFVTHAAPQQTAHHSITSSVRASSCAGTSDAEYLRGLEIDVRFCRPKAAEQP
jgi:hypothetical protein